MNLKSIEHRFAFIAGTMFWVSIALWAIAAILLLAQSARWLIAGLVFVGGFLFCVNLVIPSIALLLGKANLAYAWLRGRNPLGHANVPWEELSRDKRRSVYVESVLALIMVIAYIVWLVTS